MVPAFCRRKEYVLGVPLHPLLWKFSHVFVHSADSHSFPMVSFTSLVTDMLLAILNTCSKEELDEDDMILNLTETAEAADTTAGAMDVDPAPLTPSESNITSLASGEVTPTTTLSETESVTTTATTPIQDTDMTEVTPAEKQAMKNRIRQKMLAVARLSRMYAVLRNESEAVSELKDLMGTTKLPYGSLALGAEGLKRAINSFEDAKKSDQDNERLPPTKDEKPKEAES